MQRPNCDTPLQTTAPSVEQLVLELPDEAEPVPVAAAYADADGVTPAADVTVMVGYDEDSADAEAAAVEIVTKLEAACVVVACEAPS